jgi:hypothetical protein
MQKHVHPGWGSLKCERVKYGHEFRICLYVLRHECSSQMLYAVWCLSNYARKNNHVNDFQIKQRHGQGPMLWFAYSWPDCWLEARLHAEGPATGQLDQGFLSSLGPTSAAVLAPKFHLHCVTCSPPHSYTTHFVLI